jgi:hypothetical protein
MVDYREELYRARWHLDVAKRMFAGYDEYGGKRFLVGVIREGAKGAGKLIRAFLIRERTRGNLKTFVGEVGPKYLDDVDIESLVSILNIERDQRRSRVEFSKGDSILLEVEGKWKVLKVSRLKEVIDNVNSIVHNFPTGIKR